MQRFQLDISGTCSRALFWISGGSVTVQITVCVYEGGPIMMSPASSAAGRGLAPVVSCTFGSTWTGSCSPPAASCAPGPDGTCSAGPSRPGPAPRSARFSSGSAGLSLFALSDILEPFYSAAQKLPSILWTEDTATEAAAGDRELDKP